MGLKVLVCGGRDYKNKRHVWGVLKEICDKEGIDNIIHGGAIGADTLAGEWARKRDVSEMIFPVSKEDWEQYGRSAGPRRNQFMLDYSTPDYAVIFPGGKGTIDMASRIYAKMDKTKIRDERKIKPE